MNEGGQSSTGQLLARFVPCSDLVPELTIVQDFMIDSHPACGKLKELAKQKGVNHFVLLTSMVHDLAKERNAPFLSALTKHYYVYPDLHGNRSPLADVRMRGMITGVALDATTTDLVIRYLATCEAIALQTRQIMDAMNDRGHKISSIFMSGGLVKNGILMQLFADVCNVPVQLPFSHSASVVLGSAILGRVAAEEAAKGAIKTQEEAEKRSHAMKDRLWEIMVCRILVLVLVEIDNSHRPRCPSRVRQSSRKRASKSANYSRPSIAFSASRSMFSESGEPTSTRLSHESHAEPIHTSCTIRKSLR